MPELRSPRNPIGRGQNNHKRPVLTTYYRSKTAPASLSPFQKKPPRRNGRKILFGAVDLILLAALVIAMLYSLVVAPHPKIVVNSSAYHAPADYSRQIQPLFGSLKNRNKISFDEAGVVSAIQTKFPEVQSAQVELPFFSQQPTVRLTISPPAFRLQSGTASYVVDYQGLAVAPSQSLPKLSELDNLTDQSGYRADLGKQLLSSQAVAFIATVIAQVHQAKLPLSSLTLPAIPQELDLRTSDQPYYVKFYIGGDADIQTGQYLAARQQFAKTGQTPSQYLDVRVGGKIFYK